jgi:hypothetical protein
MNYSDGFGSTTEMDTPLIHCTRDIMKRLIVKQQDDIERIKNQVQRGAVPHRLRLARSYSSGLESNAGLSPFYC